jgi:hypothetical protein
MAPSTKGTQALWLEVLIAAERQASRLLERQLHGSQADRYSWALSGFDINAKAYRWVRETRDLETLGAAGITRK